MSLPLMYTVLRVIFGAGLLFSGYLLIGEMRGIREIREIRWIGFLFYSFRGAILVLGKENGTLKQAGEFWTGFDPIFRITGCHTIWRE